MRIAVVGAGAAATSLLHELFDRSRFELPEVHVVEGATRLGSGGVFRPDLESAMVNRQARCMSVRYDDQDDFVGWLAERGLTSSAVEDAEFYSRSLFGEYLEDRFAGAARSWALAGAPLQFVRTYVDELREVSGQVLLHGETTGWATYDAAVLCTGHGRQDRADAETLGLVAPYPLKDLVERARPAASIAIIGAGLTAMDSVSTLLKAGIDGRIALFSRTGILPDVRADFAEDIELVTPPFEPTGPSTVARLCAALLTELRAHGIGRAELDDYLDRLRGGAGTFVRYEQIPRSHQMIQNICISLANRDLPAYWDAFDTIERRLFHDRYYRLLQAVCSPVPLTTVRRLAAAAGDGRVRLERGTPTVDDDGRLAVDTERGPERFDLVVDATGGPTSAGQVEFEAGLALSAGALVETYGGVRVERATGRLVSATEPSSRIHVLGYATRGSLLYSSSLYQATRNAQVVADHLARSAAAGPREPLLATVPDREPVR